MSLRRFASKREVKNPKKLRNTQAITAIRNTKRKASGRPKKFRSKLEEKFWDLYHKQFNLKYEPCRIAYTVIQEKKYLPDFVENYEGSLDRSLIFEVKGYFKPEDRTKIKNIMKAKPDLNLIMCFDKDNYLSKAKYRRYSDWCRENRIPYCLNIDINNIVWCSNPNNKGEVK